MPINIFVNEIFQLEPSVVQDRFNSINNVNSVIYVMVAMSMCQISTRVQSLAKVARVQS